MRGTMARQSAASDIQSRLLRRRQLRDAFLSPAKLTGFYCLYLVGILVVHYAYSPSPSGSRDWFRAAVVDNYAFFGILAYPILIAYLQLTEDIDTRFRDMVSVLAGRGTLRAIRDDVSEEQLVPLRPSSLAAARRLDQIELQAARLGERTGWLVGAGVALAIAWVGWSAREGTGISWWYLAAIGALHAPIALPIVDTIGARLMRLVCYGIAVYRHRAHGVIPVPLVEHSDRAGGLKPLGDFFLGQCARICLMSGFTIISALFLLVNVKKPLSYLMLGSGTQDAVHGALLWVFIGCSVFILAMQLLAVVVPLWTVHLRMVERKRSQLGRAAIMTRKRQRLLARLSSPAATGSSIGSDSAQLAAVERWIGNYEAFPTWPMPPGYLRSFWGLWSGATTLAFGILTTALFGEDIPTWLGG